MWRRHCAIARAANVRHLARGRASTAPVATHRRLEYVYQSGYGRGRQDGVADGFGEGAARGYGQGRVQGYAEGVSSGKVQGKAEGAYEGFGAGHYHGHRDGYEQGLAYGHRQGFETGREDGKKAGRAEGFDQGRHEGKMAGLAEGKDVGIAEGRSEGQRLGFETGVQEGLAKGRHEGYQHGHADGYDERAHFEAEARRLAALPRFVRPPRRSTSPPYQQAPWRPPGNSSSEPLPPQLRGAKPVWPRGIGPAESRGSQTRRVRHSQADGGRAGASQDVTAVSHRYVTVVPRAHLKM